MRSLLNLLTLAAVILHLSACGEFSGVQDNSNIQSNGSLDDSDLVDLSNQDVLELMLQEESNANSNNTAGNVTASATTGNANINVVIDRVDYREGFIWLGWTRHYVRTVFANSGNSAIMFSSKDSPNFDKCKALVLQSRDQKTVFNISGTAHDRYIKYSAFLFQSGTYDCQ